MMISYDIINFFMNLIYNIRDVDIDLDSGCIIL